MKLNNKGITLTEIIISIALIAIVLVFLASLLVTVNDINNESEVNSTYLINKSLILKNIESDLRNTNSLSVSACSISDIYSNYGGNDYFTDKEKQYNKNLEANFCYEFNYGEATPSRLGIYYYKKRNSYVISYINKNNDIRVTKELQNFEKNNVTVTGDVATLNEVIFKTNSSESNIPPSGNIEGFFTMTIPILGDDGKDYSIIVSYYK